VRVQFELRNLESFDPVTQELYRHHPATIHTQAIEKLIWLTPATRIRNHTPAALHRTDWHLHKVSSSPHHHERNLRITAARNSG
jgi:hypothetical protein